MKSYEFFTNIHVEHWIKSYFKKKGLTKTGLKIVLWLNQGLNYTQIADNLEINMGTLKQHMTRIYKALNVSRRYEIFLSIDFIELHHYLKNNNIFTDSISLPTGQVNSLSENHSES